jgi:hypothetical protein
MKRLYTSIFASCFLLTSCTVYTEKQSEALSQNVYATNDSLEKARVDLAYYYSEETTRLVRIPKKRIDIQPIYDPASIKAKEQTPSVKQDPTTGEKTRIVMVPEQYKNGKVVVVGSTEYQELLKTKEIAKQLAVDNANVLKAKADTDVELQKQQEMHDKMIKDLNIMQKKLVEKDLAILWRNIIIGGLLVLIGGYTYFKFFVL